MTLYNFKIYALTDDRGLIRYIGYTGKSLEHRLLLHLKKAKQINNRSHNANWIRSMLSIGITPQIKLIEDNLSEDIVKVREIYYIKYYRDNGFDLTNTTVGGDGVTNPSDEIRKKISETKKKKYADGILAPNFLGHTHTEETKNKMRVAKIGKCNGKNNSFWGKTHTDETKLKISQAGRNRGGKKIIRTDSTGLTTEFKSISEASRITGVPASNISIACSGKIKQAGGFLWEHKI